jgi:hypothetical protein
MMETATRATRLEKFDKAAKSEKIVAYIGK